MIKKQEEIVGYQTIGDTGVQVPIRFGSSNKFFDSRPLGEIDEDLARRSTVQSTISGEPARGFKEAKFKPRSMEEAAAFGVTPTVGAELPRGVTREQIYNLARKYGGGLGRAADIASKLYGTVRGLTALQRATASGTDAFSALGTAGLQGYTAAQTLAPVAVKTGTGIGSRFGRDVALAGAEPEAKPQPTIAEPMAQPTIEQPTSAPMPFSPPTIEMQQEMLRQALENQAKWNEENTIQYTSDGRPLFGKVNPYNEQVQARMYKPQGGFSDAFLGVNNPPPPPTIPTGPATPPPNLNRLEEKTAAVLGSAIGPQPNINNQPPKQSMTNIDDDDNEAINQFKQTNQHVIQGG